MDGITEGRAMCEGRRKGEEEGVEVEGRRKAMVRQGGGSTKIKGGKEKKEKRCG